MITFAFGHITLHHREKYLCDIIKWFLDCSIPACHSCQNFTYTDQADVDHYLHPQAYLCETKTRQYSRLKKKPFTNGFTLDNSTESCLRHNVLLYLIITNRSQPESTDSVLVVASRSPALPTIELL